MRVLHIYLAIIMLNILNCHTPIQPIPDFPMVIITDENIVKLQMDPFELKNAEIHGDTLKLEVSYSGGCAEHEFKLYMSPAAFMESYPVQAYLYPVHNAHSDLCDALIITHLKFDLRPIAQFYQQLYGRKDEIILHVFNYFETEPEQKQTVHYFPK